MVQSLALDLPVTLAEVRMNETAPLADVTREVFRYLSGRRDAVVFGAHAVNAYVGEPRMTSDVDVLSTDGRFIAEGLRNHLSTAFHIAVRVRSIGDKGYRIYQVRRPKNRHLVDVRQIDRLPRSRRLRGGVAVVAPAELAAMKVVSLTARQGQEKGLTDRLDLHRLLRRFPRLRSSGQVERLLERTDNGARHLATWSQVLSERLVYGSEDEW